MSADDDAKDVERVGVATEADDFLRRFHRPAKPPAPEPEQRPQSDGGDFVAYDTIARPVPATRAEVATDAGVHVDAETSADLASLIRSGDSTGPAIAQRDVSTLVHTQMGQRAMRLGVVIASLGCACAFIVLALARAPAATGPGAAPSATGLASAPSARAALAAIEAPKPAIPAPAMTATPVASSTASTAPSDSTPRPARARPKPAPPRDETTDLLPDEP